MLNNFKLPPNYILVSLDVVNLFGNITEDLVYEAVKERWDNIEQHCSIQKEKFMNIIEFLLKNGYFVFEGRYFIQTLGCSMGSKLSPILSLYVMDYLIRKCIPKLIFKPPFLKKFVDDVITAIPNTEKENVLTIFNGFNEHIQFTMEEEDEKQSIPFLDTRVYRCDDIIKLDWYTKSISSDRCIHYLSDHTTQIKINFIKEKIRRIKKICHPDFVSKSIKKLQNILLENSYPPHMIKKLLFSSENQMTENITENSISEQEDHERETIRYCSIPNIRTLTTKIKKCFNNRYNIRVITKNQKTVANLYSRLKYPIPKNLRTNVIYQIKCMDCDNTYVGQTSQLIKNRITLHRSDIRLNNRRCALSIHANEKDHKINLEDVEILDSERNYKKRTVLEMIHIRDQPNPINKKTDTSNLSNIYTYLLSLKKEPLYNSPVEERRRTELSGHP
ncbi:uncharacterized protein LOC123317345 [Coccinella septempunctata]|uniref:uncharacterized protein LOC123317345 n=1 Tax=Coccinella septempunctata TaxID=41139 RepID=UPI001D07A04F|nr:uncharacterized protein LOC123317345 [Coccinella septempunctata]